MSKGKLIVFLFLVLLWMPGVFTAYMVWLLTGTHTPIAIFVGLIAFMYALFVPCIINSFWSELVAVFRK